MTRLEARPAKANGVVDAVNGYWTLTSIGARGAGLRRAQLSLKALNDCCKLARSIAKTVGRCHVGW